MGKSLLTCISLTSVGYSFLHSYTRANTQGLLPSVTDTVRASEDSQGLMHLLVNARV